MGRQLQVLVLEDDPALRFALTQILEEAGHTPHGASDIPTACEILENITPDVLLLDLMIGPVDSIPVADLAGYRYPNADVVYLTGSNQYPKGELFNLSGNTSWVFRKPIDFVELKAMLAHLDSSHGARPTVSAQALSLFN